MAKGSSGDPEFTKLLKKQQRTARLIANFIVNLRKTGQEGRTVGFLKARLKLIDSYWQDFLSNHDVLCDLATIDDEADVYFQGDQYSSAETSYLTTLTFINEELTRVDSENSETNGSVQERITNSVVCAPTNPSSNLPRIVIPKFSGNYLEWTSFRDLFTSLIKDNASLSDVQRLHYLKANLTGEAEQLLRNVTITAANYTSAWQALVKRYENTRMIVNNYLQRIHSFPGLTTTSANQLKGLVHSTTEAVEALKALGRPTDTWDDWLIFIVVQKLDHTSRKEWEDSVNSTTNMPTFAELESYLLRRIRTLDALQSAQPIQSRHEPSRNYAKRVPTVHVCRPSTSSDTPAASKASTGTCPHCGGKHLLGFCHAFRNLPLSQRQLIVKKHDMCTNCLSTRHSFHQCQSTFNCRHCGERHHSRLHSFENTSTPTTPEQSPVNANIANGEPHLKRVLLATASINVLTSNGLIVALRALLDQGSQATFISESAVQLLSLQRLRVFVPISGISASSAAIAKYEVELNFTSSLENTQVFSTNALVLPQLTNALPERSFPAPDFAHLQNVQLADPQYFLSSKIDVILGADVYASLLRDGIRVGPTGTPILQNTALGWIISGPIHHIRANTIITLHAKISDMPSLDTQLRQFWEMEEVEVRNHLTEAEETCETHFVSNHHRQLNGRYMVGLPLKVPKSSINLSGSRRQAVQRLLQLEKRFRFQPELKRQYCEFMHSYERLGHMKRIKPPDQCNSQPTYYIPHHCIFKESSSSTKLRVVFDASSKSDTGSSLNDLLFTGPKLQQDLAAIIMRWRTHPIVFVADIEKMFRQIDVNPDDCDLQRIVWRNSPTEEIEDYQLATVTYGTACAPYLAIRTLRQLALDEQHSYPEASHILINDCYVDDILSGSQTIASSLEVQHQLIQLLQGGGFTLRKWSSNSPMLLNHLPPDFVESCNFNISNNDAIKTLGIYWSPHSDSFGFKLQLGSTTSTVSKRSLLSEASKLYDPQGWLAPVTVTCKILFQKLWLTGLSWDETLPDEISERWLDFRQKLVELEQLQIPRWLGFSEEALSSEIHGFSDASLLAYSAVVYVRTMYTNGSISVHLIAAKTKVAPIKQVSLPRLELCGAVLLTRLINKVCTALTVNSFKKHCWTDSTIVLAWIQNHASRWQSFVANRVSEIQSSPHSLCWRHVSSSDNPADCASRGLFPNELLYHQLWWHGPSWLRSNEPYDDKAHSFETSLETRKHGIINAAIVPVPEWELISKYSSLSKLIRVTAYCLRFVKNIR